jgi:cell division protein FtsW
LPNTTRLPLLSRISPLIWLPISITIIGLFFISLASPSEAKSFGSPTYFLERQFIWAIVAFLLYFIATKIPVNLLFRHSIWLYLISIVGLIIVLIPQLGHQALGASRWFRFGQIGIQPTEIFKLTGIIVFSQIFSQAKYQSLKYLLYFLCPPLLLILLEPNFSAVVLICAITISIYYLSGASLNDLVILSLIGLASGCILVVTSPYRLARFNSLTSPDSQKSYHSQQLIISLSAGGWFGKGLTNSNQKFQFLPKISTDSIMAVIAEETGIVGIVAIFYLYLTLIGHLFKLSKKVIAPYSLFVAGIACWLAFQALVNAAAVSSLVPLTGVPLPLISYGGSSLVSLIVAFGLAKNIESKYAK